MCHIFILEVFEVLPDRSAPWHPRDPRQYQETEDGGVTAAYQLSVEKAYIYCICIYLQYFCVNSWGVPASPAKPFFASPFGLSVHCILVF